MSTTDREVNRPGTGWPPREASIAFGVARTLIHAEGGRIVWFQLHSPGRPATRRCARAVLPFCAVLPPCCVLPLCAALALCAVTAPVTPVRAQDAALLLEVQGGAAIPLGAFRDGAGLGEGVDPGASLSVVFAVPGDGRRTVYVGFSQHRFACEDAGCRTDGTYVATGFNAGLRFALLRDGRVIPWVRLGGITTRVETGDLDPPDAGVSGLGFGGEAGVGMLIGARSSIALTPSLTVSGVNTTLPGGATLAMRYLSAHLGVALAF